MAAEAGIGQGGYRMGRVSDEAADLGLGEFKVAAAAAAAAGSGCYGGADLVTNGAPGKRVHRPAPPPTSCPPCHSGSHCRAPSRFPPSQCPTH